MKLFIYYFVFPGFIFSSVIGLLTVWIDRKVSARVQWRQGPPWYQGFADIGKLLYKEVIIPEEAFGSGFIAAPLIGLASVTLAVTILCVSFFGMSEGFIGDIIVVWYLFTIPAIALIYMGSTSGNPLSSVGVSREVKLLLSYDLPMIIIIVMIASKAGGFSIQSIMEWQKANEANMSNWYGIIAFVVAIFCIQAKLGRVPFDFPEAETEHGSGILMELSGGVLTAYELSKAIMLFGLPVFLVILLWGKGIIGGILIYHIIQCQYKKFRPKLKKQKTLFYCI